MSVFPNFKPLQIEDRDFITNVLSRYQPNTSELTFTNLFIWRSLYGISWSTSGNFIVFLCTPQSGDSFMFPPIGPGNRAEPCRMLLNWLRTDRGERLPRIERADRRLANELNNQRSIKVEATRDHNDYVFLTNELISLEGKKFHQKKNRLNKFLSSCKFEYHPLDAAHVEQCLNLMGTWCSWRRCEDDINLMEEWDAIRTAFANYEALKVDGAVITIDGKVEAFTLGELLNSQTAVIHIEKASPDFEGLYAAMNQMFAANRWKDIPYINREQDLGLPGLRKSKLAYNPNHFAEKFRIELVGR